MPGYRHNVCLDGSLSAVTSTGHLLRERSRILKAYLADLEHDPMEINATNKELEAFMREEMETRNMSCHQLKRTLHLAASLIELGYHDCTFAEKKNIALYNWYLIYVDDMVTKEPACVREFEQRFVRGQPQLHPVLTALAEVLLRMWDLYDPICANSIVACTFGFLTSTSIEPELQALPLLRDAQRFPWFLRERTGVAISFALMMFTKSASFEYMSYVQAIPDMDYWISLTNDLLSFHKEELAGEKNNYVHNRAYVGNKTPLDALADIAEDLRVSRNTIHAALAHNLDSLRRWKIWERGYVYWHIIQDRYKLTDLGL